MYKGLRRRRPPVAGLRIHAQNVSDGVVKDGDKTRRRELEIYVFSCSQLSNITKQIRYSTQAQGRGTTEQTQTASKYRYRHVYINNSVEGIAKRP